MGSHPESASASPLARPFVLRPCRSQATPARTSARRPPHGTSVKTLNTAGPFVIAGVTYTVDGRRSFEQILVVIDGDNIIATDLDGEVLIEHTRPAPGITYVGNGRPRGPHPTTTQPSPKS